MARAGLRVNGMAEVMLDLDRMRANGERDPVLLQVSPFESVGELVAEVILPSRAAIDFSQVTVGGRWKVEGGRWKGRRLVVEAWMRYGV